LNTLSAIPKDSAEKVVGKNISGIALAMLIFAVKNHIMIPSACLRMEYSLGTVVIPQSLKHNDIGGNLADMEVQRNETR
jgi:hypothetical protein